MGTKKVMEGQSDAHFNHTFFLKCQWRKRREIVAGLHAYIFPMWWCEQTKTLSQWKLNPLHTEIIHFNLTTWNTLIPRYLLSSANWRCTTLWPMTPGCFSLYSVEMLEMFFSCLLLFLSVARHESGCAARLYLIVIYWLNDFHISCYCSRFLLDCNRPTAVLLRSVTQDSFIWCVMIGHVATFSGRQASVLLLSLASPPKPPQLALREQQNKLLVFFHNDKCNEENQRNQKKDQNTVQKWKHSAGSPAMRDVLTCPTITMAFALWTLDRWGASCMLDSFRN